MAEFVLVTTSELDAGAKLDQVTIVKAIGHVYTYDYVARLIRLDRAKLEDERRAQS